MSGNRCTVLLAALVLAVTASAARAEVSIDFVTVGNPGNAADTTGYGAVDYVYAIGKYEVTAGQYTAFLNAMAATDTYGLYKTKMWSIQYGCKIQRSGSSGSYTYSVAEDRENRPVNYVSWGDAARFMNWLHNGQPTGAQGVGTTEGGAYTLDGATSHTELMAITRNADAKFWIPTENEWYKAAYHKNDGVTGNYWLYPTGSDSTPSNVLADPDPGNNANVWVRNGDPAYTIGSPYWMTEVGEFKNSVSPYGTFDQGGNLTEWTEEVIEGRFYEIGLSRVVRGGDWLGEYASITSLKSTSRTGSYEGPADEWSSQGFRVASVPEPTSMALLVCGGLAGLFFWRRRRRT